MNRRSGGWIPCVLAALAGVACSSPRPNVGGETHWLLACMGPEDCGDEGLSCICGVCTHVCSGSDACAIEGEVEAACFDRSSPLLVRRCDDTAAETATGVCLAECAAGSECGAEQECIDGACVPARGGAVDARSYVPSREEIDAFLDASTELDWSTPIAAPTPQLTIAGGDERITGTWVERDCDPANPISRPPYGCVQLTIAQDGTGAVSGHLQVDRTWNAAIRLGRQPLFAEGLPPVDPGVGYPPGMDPTSLGSLIWEFLPGVAYRILDGRIENGRFTFTGSTMDLWHDWCVQQTSYRWMVGDHAFSFCVPPDRELWEGMDESKLSLCKSGDLTPLCAAPDGSLLPCMCISGDNPSCGRPYCACTDAGCDADVQLLQDRVELSMQGDTMTGHWVQYGRDEHGPITLQRVMR